MRLLAAALFAGLALIAGGIVITSDRWAWSDDAPSFAERRASCRQAGGVVVNPLTEPDPSNFLVCIRLSRSGEFEEIIDAWTP